MVNRFEIIGVVELTGISPIQGPRVATARWITNGVDDFLRLPARHTVTETRQFAISSPRGEAKMAGEKRGDVSNFA